MNGVVRKCVGEWSIFETRSNQVLHHTCGPTTTVLSFFEMGLTSLPPIWTMSLNILFFTLPLRSQMTKQLLELCHERLDQYLKMTLRFA